MSHLHEQAAVRNLRCHASAITRFLWGELVIETVASIFVTTLLMRHTGHLMFVCLPFVAFVVLRVLAVLVITVVLWCLRDRSAPSLSVTSRVMLIWHEALALIRIYFLMLGEFRIASVQQPLSDKTSFIVVLLHGVYCNRGIWRPWLQRFAARTGCVLLAPNLEPVMGGLEVQARHFARWLNDVIDARSHPRLIMVGFSMGGLIARTCIEGKLLTMPVGKLICIGTPHDGSRVASYAPGEAGRDLRVNSIALSKLKHVNSDESVKTVNLYSRHDTFVVPCQNAYLPVARNESIDGIGHLGLLYSPDVQERVLHELLTS